MVVEECVARPQELLAYTVVESSQLPEIYFLLLSETKRGASSQVHNWKSKVVNWAHSL